ncbi:hypothetical protein ACQKO5_01615 [Novosphingobium subterraneum]|uniref:hypothetical protein n=1 Tax=Novosphingobium subterraneum TaxID=48936 RepID=UPI003D06EE45
MGKMRWITDAGLRFWQAYREGLEMSCPVHNRIAETLADRLCDRDQPHDTAALAAIAEQQITVH